jgi:hypothetical protein
MICIIRNKQRQGSFRFGFAADGSSSQSVNRRSYGVSQVLIFRKKPLGRFDFVYGIGQVRVKSLAKTNGYAENPDVEQTNRLRQARAGRPREGDLAKSDEHPPPD